MGERQAKSMSKACDDAVIYRLVDRYKTLPVPRLELVFSRQDPVGFGYVVEYRMVKRHLLGHLEAIRLGFTEVSTTVLRPEPSLPFRDSAHAAHDSVLFGMPCYILRHGARPELALFEDHERQKILGLVHRHPGHTELDRKKGAVVE